MEIWCRDLNDWNTVDMTLPELASMDPTGNQLQTNIKTKIKAVTKHKKTQYEQLSSCRNASIALLKSTGKVKCLEDKIEAQKGDLNMDGIHTQHVGIAHTRYLKSIWLIVQMIETNNVKRWATHGAPSDLNCHPHRSGDGNEFVVVHNGIITNYKVLTVWKLDELSI